MKDCDKQNSHISSKLRMIYVSSNNFRHPVTKTFTTLHPTTFNSTSLHLLTLHFLSFKLHPTTLHYPLIWLGPFKFPTAPFHFRNSPHSAAVLTSRGLTCSCRVNKVRAWSALWLVIVNSKNRLNLTVTATILNTERPKINFMGVLFSDSVKRNNCIESVIDEWVSMDHWWNNTDNRKQMYQEKNSPCATLGPGNPTQTGFNPYPTAFPYGNGMVLHFYQQQESSMTKTVHRVINKGLKAYV